MNVSAIVTDSKQKSKVFWWVLRKAVIKQKKDNLRSGTTDKLFITRKDLPKAKCIIGNNS